MANSRCQFPELLDALRRDLKDLENVGRISPHDRDVMRMKEVLRERIAVLEASDRNDARMAA